jgi:hypothetical protein
MYLDARHVFDDPIDFAPANASGTTSSGRRARAVGALLRELADRGAPAEPTDVGV